MASPPFALSITTPGDSDIVSQFPFNERTLNRDVIQSWILANHDTNGNHLVAIFPWSATVPATPAASLTTLFASPTGRLKVVLPDGTVQFVGIQPGVVVHAAFVTIPAGYLVPDGSAVSRSTYADLFNAIGTNFGSGDGSTTFNLPDVGGRVIAGVDHLGTVLNSIGSGGAVFSISGGEQTHLLTAAEIPTITGTAAVSGTIGPSGGGNFVTTTGNMIAATANITGGSLFVAFANAGFAISGINASLSGSSASNNTGGGAHNNIQPTIVLTALIKT